MQDTLQCAEHHNNAPQRLPEVILCGARVRTALCQEYSCCIFLSGPSLQLTSSLWILFEQLMAIRFFSQQALKWVRTTHCLNRLESFLVHRWKYHPSLVPIKNDLQCCPTQFRNCKMKSFCKIKWNYVKMFLEQNVKNYA